MTTPRAEDFRYLHEDALELEQIAYDLAALASNYTGTVADIIEEAQRAVARAHTRLEQHADNL